MTEKLIQKNKSLILEVHMNTNFWMFSIAKYLTNNSLTPIALIGTTDTENLCKTHHTKKALPQVQVTCI